MDLRVSRALVDGPPPDRGGSGCRMEVVVRGVEIPGEVFSEYITADGLCFDCENKLRREKNGGARKR